MSKSLAFKQLLGAGAWLDGTKSQKGGREEGWRGTKRERENKTTKKRRGGGPRRDAGGGGARK